MPRRLRTKIALGGVRMFLAASWWESCYHAFESSLSTRQGMLRFGLVGMILALFIIWYRK